MTFVGYRKGPLTIGIQLVRGLGTDDYVTVVGLVDGDGDDDYRGEFFRSKAGSDRQMVRAVAKCAKRIRATTPIT